MTEDKKKDLFRPIAKSGNSMMGARLRDGVVEITTMEPAAAGQPINTDEDLVSLKYEGNGTYSVETVYKGKKPAAGGPAQVATPGYREGWDNVFGKTPKREDMN